MVVFNVGNNPIGLTVSSNMKAREACLKLALLDKVEADPNWVLTEYLTDLGLGGYNDLTTEKSYLKVMGSLWRNSGKPF